MAITMSLVYTSPKCISLRQTIFGADCFILCPRHLFHQSKLSFYVSIVAMMSTLRYVSWFHLIHS